MFFKLKYFRYEIVWWDAALTLTHSATFDAWRDMRAELRRFSPGKRDLAKSILSVLFAQKARKEIRALEYCDVLLKPLINPARPAQFSIHLVKGSVVLFGIDIR